MGTYRVFPIYIIVNIISVPVQDEAALRRENSEVSNAVLTIRRTRTPDSECGDKQWPMRISIAETSVDVFVLCREDQLILRIST
mgnify:FL=1|jgi:hypothetical protein